MSDFPAVYILSLSLILIISLALTIYAYNVGFKRGKSKYVPKGFFGRPLTLDKALHEVGKGWATIVTICYNACVEAEVNIHQIKEKFGGLRFYVGAAPDLVHDIIHAAERLSFVTCENCGKRGEPRTGGWIKTLCENCDKVERDEWKEWQT